MAWTVKAVRAKDEIEAEVLLYDDIGDFWGGKSAKNFVREIKELGEVSKITLRINSAGGEVFDAQAMYSYLKTHKAFKTVRIDGLAASAASFLAMVGDKIVMPENAMMMIHNPGTFAYGEAEDMRKAADFLDKVRDTIAAVYVARTDLDYDKIKWMMDEETWMSAEEAKELGFCDEIGEAIEIAARARSLSEGDVMWKTAVGEAVFSRELAAKMPESALKAPLTVTHGVLRGSRPLSGAWGGAPRELKKEEEELNRKNIEEVKAAFPQLSEKHALEDAEAAAYERGVNAERERMKELDSLAEVERPLDKRAAIIARAKYEEPRDARDVAMELLRAVTDAAALEARKADASVIDAVLTPLSGGLSAREREEETVKKVAETINGMRGYK
jgi:ATP-dependent protease ClpP protease subunit